MIGDDLDIPDDFKLDTPEKIAAQKVRLAGQTPKHRLSGAAVDGKIKFDPKLVEATKERERQAELLAAADAAVVAAFRGKQLSSKLLREAIPGGDDDWLRASIKRLLKVRGDDGLVKVRGTIRWCLRGEMETAVAPQKSASKGSATVVSNGEASAPAGDDTQTQEQKVAAKKTAKKATKKAAKVTKPKSDAKRQRFTDDMTITKLVDENPKREGTAAHKAFSNYRNGMKVKTALENGVSRADLSWDVSHNFIKIA